MAGCSCHCRNLLAENLGCGEKRASFRSCIYSNGTPLYRHLLSNYVEGDFPLGKVNFTLFFVRFECIKIKITFCTIKLGLQNEPNRVEFLIAQAWLCENLVSLSSKRSENVRLELGSKSMTWLLLGPTWLG